jgi:superfamily I DNA and/or RNA helicase
MNSLERERTQLQHMHTHEEQAKKELLEWRNKTESSIPGIQKELKEKLGEMIEGTVQILMNDPGLVGG